MLSYEEIRQLSIKPAKASKQLNDVVTFNFTDGQADLRNPKLWLLPAACLHKLSTLYDIMFAYMAGLGHHDARLPDISASCLVKDVNMSYDFGKEAMVTSVSDLLFLDVENLHTRCKKSKQKKRPLDLTPKKHRSNKRKPVATSTPRKQMISSAFQGNEHDN